MSKRPVRLIEKYRPHRVEDFVGHPKIKAVLSKFVKNPYPVAFLFVGSPGVGKTSIAQAMAEQIGAEVHLLGSRQCNFDALERLCLDCEYIPNGLLSGSKSALHFVIIDEVNPPITSSPKSGKKLKDFIPEWLTEVAVHQADSSLRAVKSHINTHIIPRLGDCALTDVNTRTVQGFVTSLSTADRTRKTVENVLNTLSRILNSAKTFGYACGQFSRKELKLPRKGLGREIHVLDVSQQGSIIARSKEPYATMFSVLGMAGLRASEMLGLKIVDFDFQRKLIHVHRSVDCRTRKEQPTKNTRKADIPMPAELEKRVQNFIQHRWRDNPSGFLFVNRNGNTYAIGKVVEYGLWPAQDACGIPRTGLHAFRHGMSSELLEVVQLLALLKNSYVTVTLGSLLSIIRM